MVFTLIIRNNHLQNGQHSLNFAQELLSQQHTINCVYFLFDGAYMANKHIDMPTDEPNLSSAWSKFALAENISLKVCAASALRRGIIQDMLAPGFEFGSIGQLVESCDLAEKVTTL